MNRPTIHGFTLIGLLPVGLTRDGKQGSIILVDRGDAHRERYVTALWYEGDKEWIHGDYTHRLDEAIASLCSRASRASTEVTNGVFEAAQGIAIERKRLSTERKRRG